MPETRHTVGGRFAAYWDAHGGLPIFGYPISEPFVENGYLTQWFERARFEYHPENQPPYDVLLGLLGREVAAAAGDPTVFNVAFTVAGGPPTRRHLTLDLAQGGESRDPAFLQNVIPQAAALHLPLIRLDNIFNHYDLVSRAADGTLVYDFSKLDVVVDSVRAMGAQPFMCLDYTPRALLAPDAGDIDPPQSYDEWRDLVYQTVKHFNVDRGLGLKYWEVWNEPNLDYSWTGSYPDYLRLYDASRDGMRAADSTARIGGPTETPLDPTAVDWLLGWEQAQGAAGRADFVSWHSFGRTTDQITADIAAAKSVVAKHPFHPELIVSEFSVATGGPGDTSQGGRSDGSGAGAYALTSLQAMERGGLDHAFWFELKDGLHNDDPATPSYWGRWGILTHDGKPKPAYYALLAYQQMQTGLLPVEQTLGAGSGVDLLVAQGDDGVLRLLLWNAGVVNQRPRITLPPAYAARTYRATLFDDTHNNFAKQPPDQPQDQPVPLTPRRGDQLLFDLDPDAFVVLESQ